MKVYLSGTYKDLIPYREAAYKQLRRMQHDVIGMEDYVASDQRPLEKCLNDVAACDVYVGLFGWRYGYVPAKGNPQKRSITELEYRHAGALKRPRLIFVVADDAPWPPAMMDSQSGEGGKGSRIAKLRAEMLAEHVASPFTTPDELTGLVAAAIFGVSSGPAIAKQHELTVSDAKPRARSVGAMPRAGFRRFWKAGSVLRVPFLQNKPEWERLVRRFAPLWSVYANVGFTFTDDADAEIRISFHPDDGNWSYVGTQCLEAPLDQPTMNFGFVDPPEVQILHEFGHALGLEHEHNHPRGLKWNRKLVYEHMEALQTSGTAPRSTRTCSTRGATRTIP